MVRRQLRRRCATRCGHGPGERSVAGVAIEVTIGIACLAGCVNLLLRRKKTLGFDTRAVLAWLVVIAFHAVFNHVNLRFRLGGSSGCW